MGGDNAVPSFKLGFNYPWAFETYGQNFGPTFFPAPADGLPRWKDTVPRNLDEIKALGMNIVRWFILQNGLNYGSVRVDKNGQITDIGMPIMLPVQVGRKVEFRFDPPKALHPFFVRDFRLLLEMFRSKGMQLIPSLVDYPFFALPPAFLREGAKGGGGRTDVATDDTKRKRFLDTVLEPLLDVSVEFKDQIFAWEVINEPSWLTRRISPSLGRFGTEEPDLTEAQLITFLRECLERIERRAEFKNKSTVGHRFVPDLQAFPTGALPQFHYYGKTGLADPTNIPPRQQTKNAFVGEFHARFAGNKLLFQALNIDPGAPWPDCAGRDQTDTVFERLRILTKNDYQLALVWPNQADKTDKDILKLTDDAKASIRHFTGAR